MVKNRAERAVGQTSIENLRGQIRRTRAAPPPAPAPEARRCGRGAGERARVRPFAAAVAGADGNARRHSGNGLSWWHVPADAASPPLPLHGRRLGWECLGRPAGSATCAAGRSARNDGRTWTRVRGTVRRPSRSASRARLHRLPPPATRATPAHDWRRRRLRCRALAGPEPPRGRVGCVRRGARALDARRRASATERRRARSNRRPSCGDNEDVRPLSCCSESGRGSIPGGGRGMAGRHPGVDGRRLRGRPCQSPAPLEGREALLDPVRQANASAACGSVPARSRPCRTQPALPLHARGRRRRRHALDSEERAIPSSQSAATARRSWTAGCGRAAPRVDHSSGVSVRERCAAYHVARLLVGRSCARCAAAVDRVGA